MNTSNTEYNVCQDTIKNWCNLNSMGVHGWAQVMLWVGMGELRSLLMVMVSSGRRFEVKCWTLMYIKPQILAKE